MNVSMLASEGEVQLEAVRPQKSKRVVVRKYARHACAQCKKARTKCEGGEPVCQRCQKTGHECNWSLEDARRPLTRAHEQALKHQNSLLRAQVERLSREVTALRLLSSDGSSSNPPSLAGVPSPSHEADVVASSGRSQLHTASYPVFSDSAGPAQGTSSVPGATSAGPESAPLWGLVPVEDITSDVQDDIDPVGSDSEADLRRPETEFDCDVESAYENDDSSDDSDDSDVNVNKALAAPTKTLFTEQDDLHHYGLTSVFRLRRRASYRDIHNQHHVEDESADSGDDSVSSLRGIRSDRTRYKSIRSILPSSSANEADVRTDSSERYSRLKRSRESRRRKTSAARSFSPVRTHQHILLIGDLDANAWKGCNCQSDCWNRWLPKGVPLSRTEHDILLERVFLFFTSWCMRVIPEYFLRDMYTFLHPTLSHPAAPFAQRSSTTLPRLAHYSPFMHNMLLAVATAFSSDPDIRKPETRARFAEEGKTYIEEECSQPNISTVQGLGLLASYNSGLGKQTLGFTYFGMSARIAQALGLFADCTPLLRAGRLRPRQVFDRTWCFHMAAAQDACWSLYVGRECGIPLPAAKKHDESKTRGKDATNASGKSNRLITAANSLPKVFMDDPFCLGVISSDETTESLDTMAWKTKGAIDENANDDVPQSKMFTCFQWSCQLMKIGRSIMDLMNRLASSDSGTEIKILVADIDMQLDAWRQDLPAELRLTSANETSAFPHKLMMHSAFWWQHILLHRPFYHRHRAKSVDSSFSVSRCNVAAREILSILRLWHRVYGTVRYCSITLVQTIFAAGTICILQAMQASTGRRPATQSQASALSNLEELVGYLRECSKSWECAIRIADIFDKLLKEQKRAMENGGRSSLERRGRRKKRRLESLRETESAVHASQLVTPNVALAVSDTGSNHDSGGGEAYSPMMPLPDNSDMLDISSTAGPQQSNFSSFHQSLADVSTIYGSQEPPSSTMPLGYYDPFSTSPTNGLATSLPGLQVPSYPTGYFSDESYISDAPYFSTDDRDLEIPMSATNTEENPPSAFSDVDFDFDFDLNYLLNSNSNAADMDTVMPGMSMFDTTSLPGLALGPVTTDGVSYGTAHFGAYSSDAPNLLTPTTLNDMGAPANSDVDVGAGFSLNSDREDHRALFDLLDAFNGQD